MTFDGVNAAVPIETGGFVPAAGAPEQADGPTLNAALAQTAAGAPSHEPAADAQAERAALRVEAAVADLWVGYAAGAAAIPHQGEAIRLVGDGNAVASAGTPFPPLTIHEKQWVADGGRYGDSTEFGGWDEISTGDYDWALHGFMSDVHSAVEQATRYATSEEQAIQLALAYLDSVGLSDIVHVHLDGSVSGSDQQVIITGSHDHVYTLVGMPVMSMDYLAFGDVDRSSTYQALDTDVHTVDVNVHDPLTPAQQDAIAKLHMTIDQITALLNSLPPNGIFTFPDGSTVTVAELKELWSRADFVVTDQHFDNGTLLHRGGGSADRNGGDPIFSVNVEDLIGFMLNVNTSMGYILHELSHVTLNGFAHTTAINADHVVTDAEFAANEAWANSLERAIYEATGNHFSDGFLAWYSWGPSPTFSIPPPPAGGGGGGSGGGGGGGGVPE